MTVTIELNDQTAQALSGLASEMGLSIEDYIASLISLPRSPITAEEFELAMDEVAADPDEGVPLPANFSRSDLYDDHD